MKKYITVAALLAAGTAFANAEVVAVFNCGGSSEERAQWMDQSQGWTSATLGDDKGNFNNVGFGVTLSSTTAEGGLLSAAGPGGSFSAAQDATTSPYAIPEALKTLSSSVFSASTYDTLWGGSVNMWTKGSATFTLNGLAQNTDYTVYLFSARANANGGSVTWTTETDGAAWSVTTADSTTSGSTVQFDGSTDGQNASIVKVTFNTGDADSFTFSTSAAGSAFTLNGMVIDQGSTIPEPSAFGLLAGLGALALVASRRRRK